MSVRAVRPADVPTVVAMVRELAAYERAEHEARMTELQLTEALFAPDAALFGHVAVTGDDEVVGFALWFRTFSTWRGSSGLHLEDLYVRPEHRGSGYGRELLRTLADLCVHRGYPRLEWSVLDWNTPSIDFYRAVGAEPMAGWTVFRLTDGPLSSFAADRRTPSTTPSSNQETT